MITTEREPIESVSGEGGWTEFVRNRYRFADGAGARRAADLLRRAGEEGGLPSELLAFGAVLREIGPRRARLEGLTVSDRDLDLTLAVREDADDDMDEDDLGVVPSPTERLLETFDAAMAWLGGTSHSDLALRRNQVDLAPPVRPVQSSDAELLAALERIQGDLLRFERVFVDSLRTSVKSGAVLPGQRAEAAKILAGHAKR